MNSIVRHHLATSYEDVELYLLSLHVAFSNFTNLCTTLKNAVSSPVSIISNDKMNNELCVSERKWKKVFVA